MLLGAVIALQWFIITILLYHRQQQHDNDDTSLLLLSKQEQLIIGLNNGTASSLASCNSLPVLQHGPISTVASSNKNKNEYNDNDDDKKLEGVFVTIMFKSPKWFHLRYTAMLHNALANLPNSHSWRIQVFYNEAWIQKEHVLDYWHPGMSRLFHFNSGNNENDNDDNKFIWTRLPASMTKHGRKPKQILASRWFWETVRAETVVLFSGNGAFCGNHVISSYNNNNNQTTTTSKTTTIWESGILDDFDYIAAPWHFHDGMGGDGTSHSIRKRSAMLAAIDYAALNNIELGSSGGHTAEHAWIVGVMQTMNQDSAYLKNMKKMMRLATPRETFLFGGVTNITSSSNNNNNSNAAAGLVQHIPLVTAGTQPKLTYDERDTLLKHCPEIKYIFPSMHEPACFGAHPNPSVCKASICALQDKIPSSGC